MRNRSTAATADTASPASAVSIGVRVSSCANDTDASTFSSAWPGMPSAIAASAPATAAVSRALNAPRSNNPRDDRLGQEREPDRRRQREAERDLEGARLRGRGCGVVVGADMRGDGRRHHRRDGDRDDAERQLVEPE